MLKKFRQTILSQALAAVLLFGGATNASAIPVISVDLDPTTPGIQTTLNVIAGSSFTFDMVLTGDGSSLFDLFAFAADFNSSGAVLGLPGGMRVAGTIAGTAPVTALDISTAATTVPGSLLGTLPFPVTPGFTTSSGGVGIISLTTPFAGPIPAGTTIDLFSLTLNALTPGTSRIIPSTGGGLGGLVYAGAFVPTTLRGGSVTVSAIPLPAAFPLFAAALAGFGFAGYRRRRMPIE
ncbi:hypothetical protein A9Q83_11670 [Alphaproteobacteria bacterium 46_93_T64]|nr:hypothetical protein A9Q83_11670 [Alphaproteobacteria bacterium 46_93_T64]